MFLCGIARNQAEMLDLFDQVFLLAIDEQTQTARLAVSARPGSQVRTEAGKQQIRCGRRVFQDQMLSRGAIPLDGTASPKVIADTLLSRIDYGN